MGTVESQMIHADLGVPTPSEGISQSTWKSGEWRGSDVADERTTVFVVDDDAAMRERLRSLIRATGLSVRTFPGVVAFLKSFSPECPGCIVAEVRMPGVSGLELQRELQVRRVPTPVIGVLDYGDVTTAVEAMRGGASDVIERAKLGTDLLTSIQRAIAQDRASRKTRVTENETRAHYQQLTRRERQVLDLVVVGHRSREIAQHLGIREKTVEVYRSRINKKMRAHNAAELVRMMQYISSP